MTREDKNTCFDCKYHFMSDCYLECVKHNRINNNQICKDFEQIKEQEKSKVIEILNETDLPNIKDGKEVNIGHSYVYKTDCCGDRYIKAEEVKYLLKNERNEAIDEFARELHKCCSEMIKQTWGSNIAPISWAEAYADFKNDIEEIAEQSKKQKK